MSPREKTFANRSTKHMRSSYDSQRFKDEDANLAFIDYYKNAVIIVKREVNLESLSFPKFSMRELGVPFSLVLGMCVNHLFRRFLEYYCDC